jgi:hypothetical protein
VTTVPSGLEKELLELRTAADCPGVAREMFTVGATPVVVVVKLAVATFP